MKANMSLSFYKINFLLNRKMIAELKKECSSLYEIHSLERMWTLHTNSLDYISSKFMIMCFFHYYIPRVWHIAGA